MYSSWFADRWIAALQSGSGRADAELLLYLTMSEELGRSLPPLSTLGLRLWEPEKTGRIEGLREIGNETLGIFSAFSCRTREGWC